MFAASVSPTTAIRSGFWVTVVDSTDGRFVLGAVVSYGNRSEQWTTGVRGEVFIPKIPSMRVTDLAEAIAPGVPREVIGIRPGEKLHELMITSDESRHTIDAGDVYIVLPEHPWWTENGPQPTGTPVARAPRCGGD